MARSLAARGLAGSMLALLLTAAPAFAQSTTYTWTGADATDDGWFSNFNWSAAGPVAPPPASSLTNTVVVLAGNTRTTNTLDYSFAANSLTFAAGAGPFVVGFPTGDPQTLTVGGGGITVASGNANNQTFNANLALGAAGTWANNGTGALAVGGTVDNGGFLLTVGGTGNSTYNGVISGAGGLTKTGAGTIRLTGASTFTGKVVVSGGVLEVPNVANATGADRLGTIPASATADAVTISNGATLRNTNTGTTGSFAAANRGITIGAGGGNLDVSSAEVTQLIYNGVITQGANPLNKVGVGILALSGTTTGTGALNVNQGTLRLRTTSNRISDASAVTVAADGTLDMATLSDTIGSLAGAGKVTFTGTGTLTSGGNNASTTFSGVVSGAGAMTKAGTGTLTLTGVNTYTGATTVSAGTLAIGPGGSLAAGSAVTVGSGGTLAGTGTVNGTVTVNGGGAVRGGVPGGTGTLTLANTLTVNNNGTLLTEAVRTGTGTADASLLAITGTGVLDLAPGAGSKFVITIDSNGAGLLSLGEQYQLTLATVASGTVRVNGAPVSGTIPASAYTLNVSGYASASNVTLANNAGSLQLTFTPVPEPTAVLALAAAALGLGGLARRRCGR